MFHVRFDLGDVCCWCEWLLYKVEALINQQKRRRSSPGRKWSKQDIGKPLVLLWANPSLPDQTLVHLSVAALRVMSSIYGGREETDAAQQRRVGPQWSSKLQVSFSERKRPTAAARHWTAGLAAAQTLLYDAGCWQLVVETISRKPRPLRATEEEPLASQSGSN